MNRSPELKEPILYLILYPWNKATSIKKEKQSKIRLDLSPISQILSRDVASPPNLLLALALYHGLSTSCHLNIPSVSSKVEKDAHLLRKGETDKHRLDGDLENNSSSTLPTSHLTRWDWNQIATYPLVIKGTVDAYRSWKNDDRNALLAVFCICCVIFSILSTLLIIDKIVLLIGNLICMLSPRNSPKRNNSEPQELHEFFSASLGGAEVRKLSFWHDISAAEIPNLKRSDNRLAVFEARVHNYDFHFSHRGEVDGKALLRVGFDFGFRPVDPSWYFRKGGVDILIEPVRDRTLEKDSWKEKEKVEEEDFGWLFDQMKYLLSEKRLWDTKEEVAGVYFQLYDDRKGGTVTAGAMALFGEEVESAIYEMLEVEGIIGVSGAGMENKLEV